MSEVLSPAQAEALRELDRAVPDARGGLPADIFYLISRFTPMVNVDLLIGDEEGRTLLTWREDEFHGPGWHVPGGIIRFKESSAERIDAVARSELGASVRAEPIPFMIREIMSNRRDVRGHFVSLVFRCTLTSPPEPTLQLRDGAPRRGAWHWFDRCPKELIPAHEPYRSYIDTASASLTHTPRRPEK